MRATVSSEAGYDHEDWRGLVLREERGGAACDCSESRPAGPSLEDGYNWRLDDGSEGWSQVPEGPWSSWREYFEAEEAEANFSDEEEGVDGL